MKKIIAVIAGGDSSEHDVSMRSAAGISSWLDRDKFDVYVIEIRGTNWLAHLPNGAISRVFLHNFSFKDEYPPRLFRPLADSLFNLFVVG